MAGKRRDQLRFVCPRCGYSALLTYYEAAVHQRDCRVPIKGKTDKARSKTGRKKREYIP